MKIKNITILPGYNKKKEKESKKKIEILEGQKIGIVGHTGSGKSQLLYDIEKLAYGETKTKRKILINGKRPDKNFTKRELNHKQKNVRRLLWKRQCSKRETL